MRAGEVCRGAPKVLWQTGASFDQGVGSRRRAEEMFWKETMQGETKGWEEETGWERMEGEKGGAKK